MNNPLFDDSMKADKQILIRVSEQTKGEWQTLANKLTNGRMSVLIKEAVELYADVKENSEAA